MFTISVGDSGSKGNGSKKIGRFFFGAGGGVLADIFTG